MTLYLITNTVNEHKYVGITTRTVLYRWKQHVSAAQKGCSFALHRAMRKYGVEKFKISPIASAKTFSDLARLEVYTIEQLNTRSPNGYNLTTGGEGAPGRHVSDSTKKKISAAHLGKPLSEEHRAKMSLAKIGKPRPPFTEEHRRKISQARMGHGFSEETLKKMSIAKKGKPWTQARREACV